MAVLGRGQTINRRACLGGSNDLSIFRIGGTIVPTFTLIN
jgi:hypothetical protein